MKNYKLAESELKFANLIWTHEPIGSRELVKLCEKEMDWKKSTTYTVLKKLCLKGIFNNKGAVVSSLITKKEYQANQSIHFVEDTFGGSLPKFLTAFMGVIRPKIYLLAGLGKEERHYILKHEQTHIKRYDHIVKPLAFFLLALHWLNPLVWISFILMRGIWNFLAMKKF